MSTVTTEELRWFHRIDRDVYARLVLNLHRDPVHTMQVMALWMWIEHIGFPYIVEKLFNLPDIVVNAAADEAVWCLNCLESGVPPITTPDYCDLPLTRGLLKSEISLQFFHENRIGAIIGITTNVNDACLRAFEDIARQAFANDAAVHYQDVVPQVSLNNGGNTLLQMEGIGEVVRPYLVPQGNLGSGSTTNLQPEGIGPIVNPPAINKPMFPFPPLTIPDLNYPVYQPPLVEATPPSLLGRLPGWTGGSESGETSGAITLNPSALPWNPYQDVPQDERTMFVTFSRGYPITKTEIHEYITRKFGNCLEGIIMQEVQPDTQPLFARLIFVSSSTINSILKGKKRVKFVINGKHVWARLYVAK